MLRRQFLIKSSLSSIGLTFTTVGNTHNLISPVVFPKAIKANDTVGLIAPAGPLSRTAYEKTLFNLSQLELKVVEGESVRTRRGYLAGHDQLRADEIIQFFEDKNISAIICARGGYGTARLLPFLDFEKIKENPKIIVGYSDITALLNSITCRTGLVTFHGPVGASDFNDFSLDYLKSIVFKGKKEKYICDEPTTIFPGDCEGILAGGNLSLVCSLIGTPWEIDLTNKILLLEDVGEDTYRIDRMLTQLIQCQTIRQVRGIALGYFTDCDLPKSDPDYEYSLSLLELFKDRLSTLGVPSVFGFRFGHEPHNATLPIGVQAKLDANQGILKLLENPVI